MPANMIPERLQRFKKKVEKPKSNKFSSFLCRCFSRWISQLLTSILQSAMRLHKFSVSFSTECQKAYIDKSLSLIMILLAYSLNNRDSATDAPPANGST